MNKITHGAFVENVGFAERLLEGDSTEISCPVEDVEDTGEVIWISPDGTRIDLDSQDKRFTVTEMFYYFSLLLVELRILVCDYDMSYDDIEC